MGHATQGRAGAQGRLGITRFVNLLQSSGLWSGRSLTHGKAANCETGTGSVLALSLQSVLALPLLFSFALQHTRDCPNTNPCRLDARVARLGPTRPLVCPLCARPFCVCVCLLRCAAHSDRLFAAISPRSARRRWFGSTV
jgi:hypothetical protein